MPDKKTILFIEDESDLIDPYHLIFEDHGYRFLSTLDIDEALAICRKEKVDLVLLDILLPNKNKNREIEKLGFVFLKKLKADPKIKDIPVIILSNLGSVEDRERGRELGAVKYLSKVEKMPREVLDKIEEVLKNKDNLPKE